MIKVIKRVPIPMAGLMLALATTGNLVASYGNHYRNYFGILAGALLVALLLKFLIEPKELVEGFENPLIASVTPTLAMGIMVLSTYLKPYAPSAAYGIWLFGLVLHIALMIYFTKKYIFNFSIMKVFPSYFIVYVGIVVASVTAPAYGMNHWGQLIFWFGFIAYIILLPMVVYRVFVIKAIPEPALPTLIIFAAPASLCLAGYLNSFQEKNIMIIGFLAMLAMLMAGYTLLSIPKLLKLKFYPSYSAFTFPYAISAVAIKGTNGFLLNTNRGIDQLKYVVKFFEAWSILIVLYVLIRYIAFIIPTKGKTITTENMAPNLKA